MLKNSDRNCSFAISVTGTDLYIAELQVFSLGARMMPVPPFPKNPKACAAKAAVLNHWLTVFGPEMLPTQCGLEANPLVPVAIPGAKTNPLSITVTPEKVQPPKAFATTPLLASRSGRFQT